MSDGGIDGHDVAQAGQEDGGVFESAWAPCRIAEAGRRRAGVEADEIVAGGEKRGQQGVRDGAFRIPAAGLPAEADGVCVGLRRGMKVARADGIGRQAQGMGEFHDLHVAFRGFGGRGGIEGDETVRPRGCGEKGKEFGLSFERDGRGAGAERGEVAGELDGVAEAVVAADEDVAAIEGAAVPHPAQVVGFGRVVACGGIALGECFVGNAQGAVVVTGPHGRHPVETVAQ